jgi:hypothetical protein
VNSPYRPLLGLIAVSLALSFVDVPIIHGLVAIYAAMLAAIMAVTIPRGETQHFLVAAKPFLVMAMIPTVWMLLQVVPVSARIAHPIWLSAEAALGRPVWGSITVDPGATVVVLCRYLSIVTIAAVSLGVSIDRQRAEGLLAALCGLTSAAAILMIIAEFFSIGIFRDARLTLAGLAAQGVVLTATGIDRAIERYETRRTRTERAPVAFAQSLSASLAAFIVCLTAVVFLSSVLSIVVMSGLALLIVVIALRRLGFEGWVTWLAIGLVIALPVALALAQSDNRHALTTRFTSAPDLLQSTVQRLTEDTPWTGSGAGTFDAMFRIYRPLDLPSSAASPTTAAQAMVELGRPMFWALVLCAIFAIHLLLRGAMERGRDSFYPAAAASSLVILMLQCFVDASLTTTPVLILAAVVLGLGISQRVSRKPN